VPDNGRVDLPRVTEILDAVGLRRSFRFLDPERRVEVLARGRAVHLAMQYHAQGVLREETIHPVIAPYWQGYRRFLDDTGHVALASEIELVHPFGFVAHPDRIGSLGSLARVVIDFKSGSGPDPDEVSFQLGAYRLAWDATHPDAPIERCVALVLDGEGSYRLLDHDRQGAELGGSWAMQTFTAALIVFRARQRMGR
jgi:hypothetical protein